MEIDLPVVGGGFEILSSNSVKLTADILILH